MEHPSKYNNKTLLLLLIVFLILNNLIWYNSGHKPLHWDSSTHLDISVNAFKTFEANISNPSVFYKLLDISWYYPPLVYYASIPFYFILGINEFSGFIEINAFLILLVVSVYLIGNKLYKKPAGLFGAFCISMFPIVIEYSRDYMLDLPLASIAGISVFLLIKTENFGKVFFCILTGLSLGCGMLIKWTFIFFLITPLIFFLLKGWTGNQRKLKVFQNFFLSMLACFIICLPWYFKNLIVIFSTRSGELGRTDLTLLQSVFYYVQIIPEQISFIFALLFIIGIILFARGKSLSLNIFLLFWFTGSYIVLTLVKIKAPRFSISLLIPLTLLISGIIFNDFLSHGKRKVYLFLFILAGLVQYLIVSFSGLNLNYTLPLTGTPVISILSYVKFENYNLIILSLIEEDRIKNNKGRIIIRIIPDEANFNISTLKYYANVNDYPLDILGTTGFPLFTDYVVIEKKISGTMNPDDKRTELTQALLTDTSIYSGVFKAFKKVDMPDGNELVIFKPEKVIDQSETLDSLKMKVISGSNNFLGRYLKPNGDFNFEINFEDTASALSGNVKSLKLFADEVEFGDFSFKETGLKINNFDIELKDFDYAMKTLLKYDKLDILSLNGIKVISFEINTSDLKKYIEKSTDSKVLIRNISFENNLISIEGYSYQLNTDFFLELTLSQTEDSNLIFEIEKIVLFKISLPNFLLNFMLENYNPLIKVIDFIKDFKLNKLEIKNNKIIIKNGI